MKISLSWRVWVWIIVFIFALISIFITPTFGHKGVLVTNVVQNSTIFNEGLRNGEVIQSIDGKQIQTVQDFLEILKEKTNLSEDAKTIIQTKKGNTNKEYIIFSNNPLEFSVSEVPKSNLRWGLDLAGGSRAIIQAENHSLTLTEANDLVEIMRNRFNAYGVSEMNLKPINDLDGNYFVLIEIAGATPRDLKNLVSQQGKFEAKIGEQVVFIGGERDVADVSRSGQDSGIYSCNAIEGGYVCQFRFTVYLSQGAATRHAEITKNLDINRTQSGVYLNETLDLYLDDKLMDSLLISEGLKGVVTTQISIQGSAVGETESQAYDNAKEQMKNLQTILITGSLPFQLEIVKLDTISPTLGDSFFKYILIAGGAALALVALTVFLRYRSKAALLPVVVATTEIIITLGVAAFLKWDLDLPSIAGILAAIGTGIDDQIVILDEASEKRESMGLKQRIKRAFAIITGAYLTTVASLIPLWWAGAGLLKGFVFTTLVGISLGVLITRPAFADLIKAIKKE